MQYGRIREQTTFAGQTREKGMFNLLGKAWTQLVAGLHDLLDRFSDAGRTARQGVRELDGQIRQAEESVTDVAAELRLMQHESDKQGSAADKWGRVAKIAADNGDRNGAVEAVQHQVQAEELAQNYAANVARLTPMLAQLKARLSDLRQKKMEMEHKTSVLDARSKVAKAESRAATYLGNVGTGPSIDFEELEKKVDREEARAAARADMAHEKAALDVDKRLQDYSRRDAISEKLQALGLMPVGAQPQIEKAPLKLDGEKDDSRA
ncbi:PspA/IM30 family protein [Ralstonia insidiosa]|uniref:PspA/IM30 family protein n=1 Tax=Ralstonia insidiosa TaxID=190721 RepID=A0A848P5L6_9RALS|nr:PspA/IM30 family protein [Ralstonia insidiosa]NMV39904.1 PspA/IM30 family protein [Ralstonia insidiosa]